MPFARCGACSPCQAQCARNALDCYLSEACMSMRIFTHGRHLWRRTAQQPRPASECWRSSGAPTTSLLQPSWGPSRSYRHATQCIGFQRLSAQHNPVKTRTCISGGPAVGPQAHVCGAPRPLLAERRQHIGGKLETLRGGLAKLAEARAAVDGLAAACQAQRAALAACKAACEALLVRIVQHKRGADERERRVRAVAGCNLSWCVMHQTRDWQLVHEHRPREPSQTCACRYKRTRREWLGRQQMPRRLLRSAKHAWTARFLRWQRLSRRCACSQTQTLQSCRCIVLTRRLLSQRCHPRYSPKSD